MKEFADDAVLLHEADPRLDIVLRHVGQPYRFPLVAFQRPPAALAVGTLEAEAACDDRVLVRPAPRGMAATVAEPSDLDDVECHGSVQHRHVADGQPGVDGPCLRVGVPSVHRDPSMKRSGFIREGKRLP
jgi:hypothetical protein